MQKFFIFIITAMCIYTSAFGAWDPTKPYTAEDYDYMDKISQSIPNAITDTNISEEYQILKKEFNNLKNQIAQELPDKAKELEQQTQNMTLEEQLEVYKHCLAEQAYEDYKNYFINELEKKSKETGRKIVKDIYYGHGISYKYEQLLEEAGCEKPVEIIYELYSDVDNKQICNPWMYDNDETKWPNYTPTDSGEKYRKYITDHTCLYPDKYEEFQIYIEEFYPCPAIDGNQQTYKNMYIRYDVEKNDAHVIYDISFDSDYTNDTNGHFKNTNLAMHRDVSIYSEYSQWRNANIKDYQSIELCIADDMQGIECEPTHLNDIYPGAAVYAERYDLINNLEKYTDRKNKNKKNKK